MIRKIYTKVSNGNSEWDFITVGYNTGEASISITLKQEGEVNEVISDGVTNLEIKLNGVIVTAPFTIECDDTLDLEFDPAPKPSNIIFEGIYEECAGLTNFDITADWSLTTNSVGVSRPVTDKTTFIQFLTDGRDGYGANNYLVDVVVTNFKLVGGRLTCNLSATGTKINLMGLLITEAKGFGDIDGLKNLELYGNLITVFDPIYPLPNTVESIVMISNLLTYFDPALPLPTNLNTLNLGTNKLTEFNPTAPLPTSLTSLSIGREITTAGWTISEAWATLQPPFDSLCSVYTFGNTNSANGTNFKSILETKNCSISA